MRIIIDLQGTQSESRFRGIGRYSLSLAKGIIRNRGEHEVIIVLNGLFLESIEAIRIEFNGLLPQENIRVWYVSDPVSELYPANSWRREVAELAREAFIASLQPDIIHITSLFEGYIDDAVTSIGKFDQITPVSVTLFDLIPLLNQDEYLKPKPSYKEHYLKKINYLNKSSLLLAISEYTREEGINNLELDSEQIVNISGAADDIFQPLELKDIQKQNINEKFKITRSFLLYTGGADERKNLARLIRAYAQLSVDLRDTHQLVFAGAVHKGFMQPLQEQAKLVGLRSDELIFTGYITDTEVVNLYNLCKLYVFPSWHEGFGLPALEAMSCGAAVIGANTSSLPEVIDNEDALFDPFSEEAIADKITLTLTDENFRQSLIEQGLRQAKNFSWDSCAKVAIKAFERVQKTNSSQLKSTNDTASLIAQIGKVQTREQPSKQDIIKTAKSIAFNTGITRPKQLFVDISVIVEGDAKSGIQRVVRSILYELLNTPPSGYKVQPIYFDGKKYLNANNFISQFRGVSELELIDEVAELNQDDIYLALDLNAHLVSLVHHLHMELKCSGVRMYYIVYDILLVQRPDWWPKGTSDIFTDWLKSITEVATGLICISESVANDVKVWMEENPPKCLLLPEVRSFHLGADVENSLPSKGLPENSESILQQLTAQPSFLMVGTIEPRKRQGQILDAFELLWEDGKAVNLVIVGKEGWLVDELIKKMKDHPQRNKRFFWLDGISDEYLEKVYARSTCLIAASEGEGFGLPLIEAAQHGLPIIARDIPVFREVGGEHMFYFKEEKPDVLAVVIQEWLKLYKTKKHPRSDLIPWLTWEQSVKQLLSVIGKLN